MELALVGNNLKCHYDIKDTNLQSKYKQKIDIESYGTALRDPYPTKIEDVLRPTALRVF